MEFYRFFDNLIEDLPYSLYFPPREVLTPEQAAVCCNYAIHHAPHLLEALLDHCPDPNTFVDTFGEDITLLTEIVLHDNVGALDCLLRHGFDPNGEDCDASYYYSPVEIAFLYNAPCCLARLLAEPDIRAERTEHIEERWDDASDSCRRLMGAYLEAEKGRVAREASVWRGLMDDLDGESEEAVYVEEDDFWNSPDEEEDFNPFEESDEEAAEVTILPPPTAGPDVCLGEEEDEDPFAFLDELD